MDIRRVLYWLLTGALIGFGVVSLPSIGMFVLLLGLILVGFGAFRVGGAGLWAALVGFGALPAAILVWDVTSAPWACMIPGGGGSALPNVNYFTCVDTPFGTLTTYHVMALVFGVIALVGLIWPLLHRLLGRTRGAAA